MTQDMDWNLLPALDVLLAEGSVTAAAERLHLSVPATSRTLARIRRTFDDPMLVRAGRGLVPTPRALAVQARLHELVDEARAIVTADQRLDLAGLRRTFTIRANDSLVSLVTTRLVAHVAAAAPGVTLRFVPEGSEDAAPLRTGEIDLDLGSIDDLGPDIRTRAIGEEHLVGLVAADHPLAGKRPTLRRIAATDHLAVSRRGRARGGLDDVLEAHGLRRRVVATVPTFPAAAHIVARSALTCLFPARFASEVADLTGAHLYEVPADLAPISLSLAWHLRHDLDPAHRWLRDQVADAFAA